ncbi:beta-ketoacyl synthase N-terminal-like domain-containing protein [Paenibacillus kobensis]|uniref:beta-ketoacyl synthase N-terminal-like domain-containing protein n=1 Tax=Paenibacillus kobensis TaxID=59841 RepID=UPI0013E3AEE6|nr:beta-ketoacyl synthase N-terminal-like domain-containing protein [Paenibacillus kobensis]
MYSLTLAGVGVVSPAGVGTEFLPRPADIATWGQARLPDIDPASYGWDGLKRLSRVARYGSVVVGEAFRSAGIQVPLQPDIGRRTGLIVCTNHSNLEPIISIYQDALQYGVNHVNPSLFPETVMNAFAGHLSILFQIQGTNVTLSDTIPSAASAFLYARDLLAAGMTDTVICCMVTVQPPSIFEHVTHKEQSSEVESIVALLFRKGVEAETSTLLKWKEITNLSEMNEVPIIRPSDAFLAVASAHQGLIHRKTCEEQWGVSGRSNGYHLFSMTSAQE